MEDNIKVLLHHAGTAIFSNTDVLTIKLYVQMIPSIQVQ